ncbi:MAG: hypothetical protein JWO11_3943, partial [Nocardioides sp.]|nr:hypothetical protein [Nocardioides sp.]
MTDDTRAERAFRDAFVQRADALEAVPLDAGAPRSRRRRWLPAVVAAAVLVLVGGTALAGGVLGDDGKGDGPTTGTEELPAGALPAADAGWRWVSWRNVAVQVPATWAYGYEPQSDWCATTGLEPELPPEPYVSRNGSAGGVLDIGCIPQDDGRPEIFGAAPQELWAPHLTFAASGAVGAPEDGVADFAGWAITAGTFDTVQLQLWADADTKDLTDRILGSARRFTTDNNGCDITSPVQAKQFVRPPHAFDLRDLDAVDSISVCQYDRYPGDGPAALIESRRLDGQAAEDLLAGIKSAPTGGGPDHRDQCVPDAYGDHSIALRFHHDG